MPTLKPAALRPGDTIAIVAPAGPVEREALERGCAYLCELGYRPIHRDTIFDRELYFAGSTARRLDELHEAFADPAVRGIVCARGGYGANHLLPLLDFELIRRNPKVFVGLSDITTLLTAIYDRTGLVTFHGPVVTQFAKQAVGLESWHCATTGQAPYALQAETLLAGEAEGILYGGCLSLLVQSLGTPWEIHRPNSRYAPVGDPGRSEGTILFLEDVNEPAYRIDRMLMHLKLAGKLDGVRGIAFGSSLVKAGDSIGACDVVRNVVGELGIPIAMGIRSGHVYPSSTLPIGIRARLECSEGGARLVIEEAATLEDVRRPAGEDDTRWFPGPGEE
jgi:muramoyltetrapeptide carboxypeptidase